jgi:hypothetical protein
LYNFELSFKEHATGNTIVYIRMWFV